MAITERGLRIAPFSTLRTRASDQEHLPTPPSKGAGRPPAPPITDTDSQARQESEKGDDDPMIVATSAAGAHEQQDG